MYYYKVIRNGFIESICCSESNLEADGEITEQEYNAILEVVTKKPQDTETIVYKLTTNLEYIPVEVEPIPIPEPEPTEFDLGFESGYEQALLDLMELEMDGEE